MNKTGILIIFLLTIILSSCSRKLKEGMIIFTQVSHDIKSNPRARIMAMDYEKPEKPPILLTADLWSSRSPEISYDGKSMLFAAKQNENDPWQIWEMQLNNLKKKQITASALDCTTPAWLPGDHLVFSQPSQKKSGTGLALYVCNEDGSELKQITFDPYDYSSSSVLQDGRILSMRKTSSNEMAIVLRPDGTKAQAFYAGPDGTSVKSILHETQDGKIVFTETAGDNSEENDIISISYNRPLHSRENLTLNTGGSFKDVYPLKSGKMLVSYRSPGNNRYILGEFDPGKKEIGKIYDDPEYDEIEPVVVEERERPKKLPSEVDMGVKTGLLLCQDINYDITAPQFTELSLHKADRIELQGIDTLFGIVRAEKDGSVYLKVIADTPFRIKTLDKDGSTVHGPGEWIYLRPNERRGCIGCHEDPELVPENKLPLSVRKPPVNVPVHINLMKEKEISLE